MLISRIHLGKRCRYGKGKEIRGGILLESCGGVILL